jgi:ribosome biogenesis GTPase
VNARAPRPRLVAAHPAGEGTARVLSVDTGLVLLSYGGRRLRATLGADLLGAIAADPDQLPRTGDRVIVRTWTDGPVTVERVLARGL